MAQLVVVILAKAGICPKWWNLSQVMEFVPSDGISPKWWNLSQMMEFDCSHTLPCELYKKFEEIESESDTESVKYICRVKIFLWIFSVSLSFHQLFILPPMNWSKWFKWLACAKVNRSNIPKIPIDLISTTQNLLWKLLRYQMRSNLISFHKISETERLIYFFGRCTHWVRIRGRMKKEFII